MPTAKEMLDQQMEYDGVIAWHKAGYLGKGVRCLHLEPPTSDHAQTCRKRILDAAPMASVVLASHSITYDKNTITQNRIEYDGRYYTFELLMKEFDFDTISRSTSGSRATDTPVSRLYNNIKNYHKVSYFASAGNDGDTPGIAKSGIPSDVAMYVGACQLKDGKVKMKTYSSTGGDGIVDFSDFTGVVEGTSFAAPYLAGKAALVIGRYGKMTQGEIEEYFRLCAEDILTAYDEEDDGLAMYDKRAGWGLVRLPNPAQKLIRLCISDKTYKTENALIEGDAAPFITNNRTMVPIRFIAEALGAVVAWDDEKRSFEISKNGHYIECKIGSTVCYYDGLPFEIDTAPVIRNNRSFVPVRFVAEYLGCKVGWVEELREVIIIGG